MALMMAGVRAGNGAGEAAGRQKTVLITGVSRGLGKALAVELGRNGHTIIGCSRSQDKLEALKLQLSSSESNHLFVNVDVVSHFLISHLLLYLLFHY